MTPRICIVFKGNIFDSTAPANRVLALAKGLKKLNADISIYGVVPLGWNEKDSKGYIYDIEYQYSKFKSNNFIIRSTIAFYDLMFRFPKFIKSKKSNLVYIYGTPLIATWIIIFFKYFFGYKVIKEQNEFPLLILSDNRFKRMIGKTIIPFSYRLLDGMVVMTKTLLSYYKRYTSGRTNFEIINMTIDLDRFHNISIEEFPYTNYLAYCGGMTEKKDGVVTLLKAFEIIANDFHEVKLMMIGDASNIKEYVSKSEFGNRIILTGKLCSSEVPLYLSNALGLVLPRPKSFQAEGGFPTKLGEYLATGKPVIVTSVGEIPSFLTDNISAYIAEPGSVKSLASKIRQLLLNKEKSERIGISGKKVALEKFNSLTESKKLYDFCQLLIQR